MGAIRDAAAVRQLQIRPEPRAVEHVGAEERVPPVVRDAGRSGVLLLVIERDPVAGDVGEVVGAEVELRRLELLSAGPLGGKIEICREVSACNACRYFGPVLLAVPIVEGRQDDRCTELAFVDEVRRLLVVCIYSGGEAVAEALLDSDVVVVRLLGERRRVSYHL